MCMLNSKRQQPVAKDIERQNMRTILTHTMYKWYWFHALKFENEDGKLYTKTTFIV